MVKFILLGTDNVIVDPKTDRLGFETQQSKTRLF